MIMDAPAHVPTEDRPAWEAYMGLSRRGFPEHAGGFRRWPQYRAECRWLQRVHDALVALQRRRETLDGPDAAWVSLADAHDLVAKTPDLKAPEGTLRGRLRDVFVPEDWTHLDADGEGRWRYVGSAE